jgi:hypothetical protein
MDPSWSPHVPHSLATGSQTACYMPWLKIPPSLLGRADEVIQ